jgi:hypothetical protein
VQRRQSRHLYAVLLATFLLGACGGVAQPTSTGPAAGGSAPASAAAAVPPSTMPSPIATLTVPPDAAPAELQGKWRAELAADDVVFLTIGETSYSINRYGASHPGHLSVAGHTIVFSRASGCAGDGTWTWSIAGGVLTFEPTTAPDPCPRYEVLHGVAYRRSGT